MANTQWKVVTCLAHSPAGGEGGGEDARHAQASQERRDLPLRLISFISIE